MKARALWTLQAAGLALAYFAGACLCIALAAEVGIVFAMIAG